MLLSRLTFAAGASFLLVTACAGADGTDGGALRENVIEPGITAIDESDTVACGSEASSFRTALEAYELLEGEPAADEQALIDAGLLREESELWDVMDGQLVAQNPECGAVPATVPAAEIVTETGSAPTAEDVLATLTDEDIALIGGADCARQLAVVVAGAARYAEREGVDPETFADAEDDFEEPVTLWQLVDDTLRPVDESGCVDFAAAGSG